MKNLEGMKIKVMVSDPWDFGEVHGCGPFIATILKEKNTGSDAIYTILIKLDNILEYKEMNCEYFIVGTRYENDLINYLKDGERVVCNFTCINEKRAKSTDPFDLSWWRGGVGLIGDIQMLGDKAN